MTFSTKIFYLIIKRLDRYAAKKETISVIVRKNKYSNEGKRAVVSNSEFVLLVL